MSFASDTRAVIHKMINYAVTSGKTKLLSIEDCNSWNTGNTCMFYQQEINTRDCYGSDKRI
ncbi:MAG: hypothetical protein ACW99A_11380 [Candidatus Kariarchaeaceae archaeon]